MWRFPCLDTWQLPAATSPNAQSREASSKEICPSALPHTQQRAAQLSTEMICKSNHYHSSHCNVDIRSGGISTVFRNVQRINRQKTGSKFMPLVANVLTRRPGFCCVPGGRSALKSGVHRVLGLVPPSAHPTHCRTFIMYHRPHTG